MSKRTPPVAKVAAPVITLPVPLPVQTTRLKRKQFASTGDVHVQGDAILTTQLIVGGDCLIDGDLQAEEVFCLGKLTVTGDIRVQSLYVGHTLDVGGNIDVEYLLKTGCSAEWMARMLELDQRKNVDNHFVDQLVHPAILARHAHHDVFGGYGDIQALGYLACADLDCQGNVQLDDVLEAGEVQFIGGHLSAASIHVAGDCNCQGELFSETDVQIEGSLFAATVICQGNLDVNTVCSQGDISTWGSLRANGEISSLRGEIHSGRWIATKATIYAGKYIKAGESVIGEKGISCGADYGILAGTTMARSRWATHGMVSAASKPRLLLSGQFVEAKKLKHIDALEKKRDTELDWEIPRRLKREMLQD
ncbi:polymer-forming cytoskeletal protein [Undibacterium sp. TJN19]|uniref:polymer-forming cytoskeletal protein n=1 Tax=Undibacterium sp. TJN19 TaxID=3413055 RepID=UPI003BF35F83